MKIAWTHTFPPSTLSAGVFMHDLANEIREQGVDIDLLYMGKLKNPSDLLKCYFLLKKKVAKYDLIHAQYGSGCGFVTSMLPEKNKFLTLRGSDWYGCEEGPLHLKLHGKLAQMLTRYCLKNYDHIYVMSHRNLQDIRQHNRYHNISFEVLPDGIDLIKFKPMCRIKAREQLGFKDDLSPWVLFSTIATNNPIKRIDLAEQAFELAKKEIPDLKMKVMSGIPHKDVPLFVNSANVILLTSTHEGWPNIIKEGLACNIPFVSTDVSDLKMISDETVCQAVTARASDLAKAIVEVINGPRPDNLRQCVKKMAIKTIAKSLISRYEVALS